MEQEREQHEHDEQADRMERVADDMEKQADKLGTQIEDTREDWKTKQTSEAVPGAVEEGAATPDAAAEAEGDDAANENESEDD